MSGAGTIIVPGNHLYANGGGTGVTAYQQAILDESPDLFMTFEASAGSNIAEVTGVQQGTPENVTALTAQQENKAGGFNGTSSQILVPNYDGILNAAWSGTSMSMMAWVYVPTGAGSNSKCICGKGPTGLAGSSGGWLVYIHPNQEIWFQSYSGTSGDQFYSQGSTVPLDTWTHVAVTNVAGTALASEIYINGSPVSVTVNSSIGGANQWDGSVDFRVGTRKNGAGADLWMDGRLDEIAVWGSRQLSAAEISTIYAARS